MEIGSLIQGNFLAKPLSNFGFFSFQTHPLPHLPMHLGAGNVSGKKCTVKLDKSEPKRAEVFFPSTRKLGPWREIQCPQKQDAFSCSSLFHLKTWKKLADLNNFILRYIYMCVCRFTVYLIVCKYVSYRHLISTSKIIHPRKIPKKKCTSTTFPPQLSSKLSRADWKFSLGFLCLQIPTLSHERQRVGGK